MTEVEDLLLKKASEYGLVPTEFFERVLKAKERGGLGIRCPCDPKNPERYCVSELCMKDIQEKGTCHCCAYKLKEK